MERSFIYISNYTNDDSLILKSLYSSVNPKHLFKTDTVFETHKRYRNYTLNEMHFSRKNNPVTSALIVAQSNDILEKMLKNMRNSIWWNPEALFLIVNDLDDGCNMAHLFLITVWSFNILSAIYLCCDSNNQCKLYTFNPYTSLAPTFWTRIGDDNFADKYWTLFQRPFENVTSIEAVFAYGEYILNHIIKILFHH